MPASDALIGAGLAPSPYAEACRELAALRRRQRIVRAAALAVLLAAVCAVSGAQDSEMVLVDRSVLQALIQRVAQEQAAREKAEEATALAKIKSGCV